MKYSTNKEGLFLDVCGGGGGGVASVVLLMLLCERCVW